MAPNIIRPSQMLIFNSGMCYVEQRQHTAAGDVSGGSSMSPRSPPAKRTYVKNISPEEKILRKKLRNREAAQLSRDKKKAQFNVLSGMVHGLRKENVHLRAEIETLRANQEQLITENERLREQLSTESSIPKSIVTEFCTTAVNNKISINGPAEGQTESNILFDALLSDSIPITDHSILHDLKLPDDDDDMDWLDNNVSKRLEKIADELLGESFLNECCLDEMVGSTSEIMEPGQNIDLPNADIKVEDDSLFMLNTDTDTDTITGASTVKIPTGEMHFLTPNLVNADIKVEDDPLFTLNTDTIIDANTVKIPTEEMHFLAPNVVVKSEIEEHSEDSLERFIIVEEAVEEVTTTYDEHILEICQEDDAMDCTEQYEDIGYESLSSPEYDYKTRYSTPPILTDLLS